MLTKIARRAASEFADTAAYVSAGDGDPRLAITYAQLDRLADEAAAGLTERGVGPGDVVALLIPSTIDYVVLYLALVRIGAVTAGINPKLRGREIAGCIELLEPALVVATKELAATTDLTNRRVELLVPGASVDSFAAEFRLSDGRPAPALADDASRPVCICFTSGSTGTPKGAWFTNRQLLAIADLDTGGAWGGGGHGISSTEFAHVGFMTKLPWLLATGRTTHLLDRWSPGPVLRLLAEHKMNAVTGVAPQLAIMVRHTLASELDFSAVKVIVAGGAASPPALVRDARATFGAPYSIRYSSTESGGIGLGTAPDGPDQETLHTIGRPRPGVEARICNADGDPVADGEIGELWLKSSCVMSGYWNDPTGTAEALVDGWLRTGDLARIDEQGLFRLTGRLKEMFIRGGYNVYPMEVESVLSEHPAIAEIAIIPRPDPVLGEIGVAVIVVDAGCASPSLDELRRFGQADLADYKLPEEMAMVSSLPRNASDKLDRAAIIAMLNPLIGND